MKKWIVGLIIFVLVLLVAWEVTGYMIVRKDANKVATDITEGKAVWSDYYKLDIAEGLQQHLLMEESPSIVTKIMQSAKIDVKVSPLLFFKSDVTFVITSVNYEDFVEYCETVGITEYEAMLAEFDNSLTSRATTTYEIPVTWNWKVTKCEKNLQTVELMDAATGGFATYYSEAVERAEQDVQNMLGGAGDEEEN